MLRSLNSGVSAMQQFQQSMDVIGNNIANVNTAGFKNARVDFADALSQTLQGAGPGGSIQVGTGVSTTTITNQFVQGPISRTGTPTDLAISGDGFFEVKDPLTGAQYVSRAGDFQVDANGYLVTSSGMRVQGYADAALSTIGDLKIDNTGAPSGSTAAVKDFNFNNDGKLTVTLADGTNFTRGQVLLQSFRSPQSLVKEGENLFSGLSAAGPLAQPAAPKTNGLGYIQGSALEMSNVDLANEFSSMITTQRAFQASARVITTSDELLQELVNLKR
ncbi:MAG TPA: flagellar hook-basal body complex protein [Candidatus Sulfotelmatobacter sp.]|nr:flagellar hook-basal body complex protein [Candidatus Sulfotelmatobacter sp.]